MKFIHFADCHIDGFREQKLADLGFSSFSYVIDYAIQKNVDFVLLSGDLFNTALPRVDALKKTVGELKKLQENDIPLYAIPGSHDFSPRGRTMLDVLERAGLLINVMQGNVSQNNKLQLEFTIDKKTNAKITGIVGKKGMLDKQYYEDLDHSNLQADGFKIFLFHTAIDEMKPSILKNMDSQPVHFLPPNFNYYAGGHVHIRERFSQDKYSNVVYPGPTFPNSFSELEQLQQGSFVLFENNQYSHIQIPSKKVCSITVDCESKQPEDIFSEVIEIIENKDIANAIVLLRFVGIIRDGKPQDIKFKEIFKSCYDNGAFIVLKNTYKLQSQSFEEVKISSDSTDNLEKELIEQHIEQINLPETINEKEVIQELINTLHIEQYDGEKKTVFVERVVETIKNVLEK